MKTRRQLLLLAGAAALALGACATIVGKRGCVSFYPTPGIEIHPGTNISPEDERKLDHILRQYKSSLYKIRNTANNQMTTRGSLQDVYIKQDFLAEVANSGGVSYWAAQIGMAPSVEKRTRLEPILPGKVSSVERTHNVEHTHNVERTQNVERTSSVETNPKDYAKSVELVRRVTPILQKYNCNQGAASH